MKATGLELDSSNILLVTVKRRNGSFEVEHFHSLHAPIPVKRLYTYTKRTTVVTGLSSDTVLCKKLEFKGVSKKVLAKTLSSQLELENFLDPNESIALPYFKESEEKTTVSIFLTSKDALKKHLSLLEDYSLDPHRVSFTGQALFRFAKEVFHTDNCFVLHLSQNTTHIAMIKEGALIRFHSIAKAKDKDVAKTFYSFLEEEKTLPATLPLLITGQVKLFSSFEDSLKEYYSHILKNEKKEHNLIKYALPIGLALEEIVQDENGVQFRKEEFTPKSVRKRIGKALFFSFFLSVLVASTLLYFGIKRYQLKKESLDVALEKIIEEDSKRMQRPLVGDFASNEEKLSFFRKLLKKETKASPFPLQAPNVEETLSWLLSHPILNADGIVWENFHYELVSFPKVHQLEDPYLAKVEVTLKLQNPLQARKISESLLHEKEFVDTQKDISLKEKNGAFFLSFYLKPRKHSYGL